MIDKCGLLLVIEIRIESSVYTSKRLTEVGDIDSKYEGWKMVLELMVMYDKGYKDVMRLQRAHQEIGVVPIWWSL